MLALQLFVVGDLSRGGGWAEVGGEGFPVAGRGVGISGIFWTLRGEGEATCVTSGLCGGRGKPRASRLDLAGEGSHVRHVWTLRGSHVLSRHWWSAQAPHPGPGAEFMQPRFWS